MSDKPIHNMEFFELLTYDMVTSPSFVTDIQTIGLRHVLRKRKIKNIFNLK
jgi:hypothetical protein